MVKSLLLIGIVLASTVSLFGQAKIPPGNDPGNNNSPPAGAILDLNSTPVPGGGNYTYKMYTVNFTASLSNTAITFAFREDPAFIYFSNPSVKDLTSSSGNLLVNSAFSGGTYTNNGNSSTPIAWVYANVYGATFGGVVLPGCGVGSGGTFGVGYCWYDGAVQAYDALTQTIATTIGHSYQISFWIADNSGCGCNFSDLSTNGDVTDTGGNGINVTVYTGAALPAPAALHITLSRDVVAPNQGMLASASAMNIDGTPDNLQDAAQKVGFNHFNFLQIDISDTSIAACATNMSLPGCASLTMMSGVLPTVPFPDPPLGGWAYEFWDTHCPGSTCAFTSLIQYTQYSASPGSPEYLTEYQTGATTGFGFSFSDQPNTQGETFGFVTSLVGVTGTCNVLTSSNCAFQIIPGTTFKWSSANGTVSFTSAPGAQNAAVLDPKTFRSTNRHTAKQADNFPTNPVALSGAELSNAIISTDKFLALANLTPTSLAALGGSISIFSGSLIPSQGAALAAVQAGLTLVPSNSVAITSSGLAYSRVTQTFNGTVTVTNNGNGALTGPLEIVFNGLPASVTMMNSTGNFAGTPYLTVPTASLAAGQSATAVVQFRNPSNVTVNLTPTIYFGSVQ
jgi:hypothetical protein